MLISASGKRGRLLCVTERAPHPVRTIRIGDTVVGSDSLWMIGGPCAVEGRAMLAAVANGVRVAGAHALRGGVFKPRTSPHSFQGLGLEGLPLLAEIRSLTGLPIVTEVLDPRNIEEVAQVADVLQVGARNMANGALLREIASAGRPVLLKRGFGATIDEFLHAADYLLAGGCEDVVLCERGIRSFETSTRFTLDVGAIPVLRQRTNLPVIVDPSHAAGTAELVAPLAKAAVAAGADGIMVEVHTDPSSALSDGSQSLTISEYAQLIEELSGIAQAVGRRIEPTQSASSEMQLQGTAPLQ